MRSYRSKNQFFAMFLLGGFLIGILYANLISDRYIMSGGIFDDGFLKQYAKTDIVAEEYLWYILRARLVPFCVICILGCMKWKKTVVGLCIGWTGFSGGVVAVSSVISLGMKGILLCIVGMLPQILFLWVRIRDSAMGSVHISEREMEYKKDGSSRNFYGCWDDFRSVYESHINEISYWIIVKREFALGCKLSFF